MKRESRQYLVVHYGELSLKGKNRSVFVRQLARNLRQALSDLGDNTVDVQSGRLLLATSASVPQPELEARLRRVFGVANFAPCLAAPHDLAAIKTMVDKALDNRVFPSFRVTAESQVPFVAST